MMGSSNSSRAEAYHEIACIEMTEIVRTSGVTKIVDDLMPSTSGECAAIEKWAGRTRQWERHQREWGDHGGNEEWQADGDW
jgi:hypothetical protein